MNDMAMGTPESKKTGVSGNAVTPVGDEDTVANVTNNMLVGSVYPIEISPGDTPVL